MTAEQRALKTMGVNKSSHEIDAITQDEIDELGSFKSKRCQNIAMIMIFFLPALIFVMMVLWVIKHSAVIIYTKDVACSFSVIASDVLNGLNYKSDNHTLTFAGMLGYDYLIKEVLTEFKFYYEQDIDAIVNKNWYNHYTLLDGTIKRYITDFKDYSIQSPNNKYAKLWSDQVRVLNSSTIINEGIDKEYEE